MGCSGKNKVGPSKLLDVSEPLELRCVNDFDKKRMQLHVSVDWIIEHLKRLEKHYIRNPHQNKSYTQSMLAGWFSAKDTMMTI